MPVAATILTETDTCQRWSTHGFRMTSSRSRSRNGIRRADRGLESGTRDGGEGCHRFALPWWDRVRLGVYAAAALTDRDEVSVDVIDRLPTPFGLVRCGVPPDHEKMTSVAGALRKVVEPRPGAVARQC